MARVDYRNRRAEVEKLPDGRSRVTWTADVLADVRTPAELDAEVWLPWGTEDASHPGCRLVAQKLDPLMDSAKAGARPLTRVYEELHATAETQVGVAQIVTAQNGLGEVVMEWLQLASASPTPQTVGTATCPLTGRETYILGVQEATDDGTLRRIRRRYMQPGVVSKSRGGGPASLPGTIRHSWQVWAMTAAEAGMPGIITDEDEDNVNGYPVRRFTSLASSGGGSPAGTLASYPTTLEITRHGTVQVAVSSDFGGDTPYLVQTPPRSGRVAATVTIVLTTAPEAPVPVAFNLDNLAVSVVAKTRTRGYVGSDPSDSIDGHVYAERIQIDHTSLRGYVFVSSSANGVQQEYEYPAAVNADGDTIAGEAFYSYIYRTITLAGSSSASAPPTTGLYAREVDPAFTALDGTKYYRVTSITLS